MNNSKNELPVIPRIILQIFLYSRFKEEHWGDIIEEYKIISSQEGKYKAYLWILFYAIRSAPEGAFHNIVRSSNMLYNYLKIAFRNMLKNKVFTFINLSGMAIGLSIFILCISFAIVHFRIDSWYEDADRIFCVVQVKDTGNQGLIHSAILPSPLLSTMIEGFSEIEQGTGFIPAGKTVIRRDNESFNENGIIYVEDNFLEMFSFDIISGSPEKMLSEPFSIVLTESKAVKYFGEEDPLGKTLLLNNNLTVNVTGIIKDRPSDTSMWFDFLVSRKTAESYYPWIYDWGVDKQSVFLKVHDNVVIGDLENKFKTFISNHFPDEQSAPEKIYLYPYSDFFLGARSPYYIQTHTDTSHPANVYTCLALGILIMLVVCLNYINLTTARSLTRAKEVGIRKVVGAGRFQLLVQFLGESILFSIMALLPAVLLYEFLLRNAFLEFIQSTELKMSLLDYPEIMVYLLVMTVIVGIGSGSYPALYLSRLSPGNILKSQNVKGSKGSKLRKTLVVSQFAFSIFLITFSMITKDQNEYLMNKDFGYNRQNILAISMTEGSRPIQDNLKDEYSNYSAVNSISASMGLPANWETEVEAYYDGMDKTTPWNINSYGIDYNFIEALELEILFGRSFNPERSDENNIIINEKAVEQFKWKEPIGKLLTLNNKEYRVIGVVKNYLFRDVFFGIGPSVLYIEPEMNNYLVIKLSGQLTDEKLNNIKNIWNEQTNFQPFEYTTLDFRFNDRNDGINNVKTIFGIIGIVAILFSCLGLIGLSLFTVEFKRKEIGVRKVLGASILQIQNILLGEFIFLIAIANIIVAPITYYFSKFLMEFAWTYVTDIDYSIFLFTFLLTLFTALLSIIYQSLKAANANPVDSLRYE